VSLACIFYIVQTKYPPIYCNDSIGEIQIWKNPEAEFNILESHTSLVELIQVSRTQTYDKRTFRGVAHWHFLPNELRHSSVKVSGYTQKHRAAELLPT